jgi:hypothetical protein
LAKSCQKLCSIFEKGWKMKETEEKNKEEESKSDVKICRSKAKG